MKRPPIPHLFLQRETYTVIWGLRAERTQKICVLHIVYMFTWECFTGVFLVVPCAHCLGCPACRRRPSCWADRFLRRLPPKIGSKQSGQHTLQVSFINDARMMLENLSLVSASSSWIKMFAGYYWNILAMYQMYDGRGEFFDSRSQLVSSLFSLAQAVGHPEMWGDLILGWLRKLKGFRFWCASFCAVKISGVKGVGCKRFGVKWCHMLLV